MRILSIFFFSLVTHFAFGQTDTAEVWIISFGNTQDTILSIQQINSAPIIQAKYSNNESEIDFEIISFGLKIKPNSKSEINFERTFGSTLSGDQLEIISNLKSKDRILLYDIKATCESCAIRHFPELAIIIK